MLHKIRRITGTGMRHIVKFQRQVLSLVCQPPPAAVSGNTVQFTQAILRNHLGNEPGDWLWGKADLTLGDGKKLLATLNSMATYFHANPQTAQAVLAAFDHDLYFHRHWPQSTFQFDYLALHQDVRILLKPLMEAFYNKFLSNGYPASIHQGIGTFSRDTFIKEYEKANPNLKVCAACDDKFADTIGDKRYADADHFFPKSKYHFLAVHPANLVPICGECNSAMKGARDPGQTLPPFDATFYPYSRIPTLDFVELGLRRIAPGWQVRFAARASCPVGTSCPATRVESLNRIFKLEDRWRGRMADIVRKMGDDLRAQGAIRRQDGEEIDQAMVKNEVRRTLRAVVWNHSQNLGSRENYLLQHAYVHYVGFDIGKSESKEFLTLCREYEQGYQTGV